MSTDWAQLIRLTAPAIAGLAAKGQHGAVLRGYLGEQERIAQERQKQLAQEDQKRRLGAQTGLELLSTLQQETDPLRFEQLRGAIANHADALGVDASMFDSLPGPDGHAQQLAELSKLLDGLTKSGYDLDQMAQAGASVRLKSGQSIPVADAIRATQVRPEDASGQMIPPPTKGPAAGSWEDFYAQWRREHKITGQSTTAQMAEAKQAYNALEQKPENPQVTNLRDLQIEGQRLRNQNLRTANAPKPAAAVDPKRDAFLAQILENPSIYDGLTPSEKTALAPDLAAKGFVFGKPLESSAVSKIAESRSAIKALQDLREILKQNEQYIGPVAGFAALNPYSVARKAQADIDRVKQRVGKALEGGVLRKEDEDKYKKILATLNDTPETAIYKVDGILQSLENDIRIFEETQQRSGRRVTPGKSGGAVYYDVNGNPVKR